MADPQLVVDVRVVNRDIGDDELRRDQPLEHVSTDRSRTVVYLGGGAQHLRPCHRWSDQFIFNALEVDRGSRLADFLGAEWSNDEGARKSP